MEKDILDLQDQLQAIERANRRVTRLLEKFHADAANALSTHAPDVAPSVVAPKEPPE